MRALSREQVRTLDRRAVDKLGIPGIVLMENAGRGATDILLSRFPDRPRYLVIAGRGNNGGDGFVIARHLTLRGRRAEVAILGDIEDYAGPGDAATNLRILPHMAIPVHPLRTAAELHRLLARRPLIVDAILGTGLTGAARGLPRDAIEAVNAAQAPVFAVDTPSGLDCDTGRPLGVAVHAEVTVTFAAMKIGFLEPGAAHWTGEVLVTDIGAPTSID